jgi:S1-C subfamily serine protease
MEGTMTTMASIRKAPTVRSSHKGLALALALGASVVATPAAHAGMSLATVAAATGAPTVAPLLKTITPAVVTIAIKGRALEANAVTARQRKGAQPAATREISAAGSGVVFDAGQGLIVTNNHVIDHADSIIVTLPDGRSFAGKLVGRDADTDIAVVKVKADRLAAISFADSDRLEVGDFVLAIGNPFMIGQTVTAGIVGGLHRANIGIEAHEDFIQTDAAIYPGNSGGALVNLRGELVGINTAFIGATASNPGVGFAIPANMARDIVDQILEYGEVRSGRAQAASSRR